MNKVFTDNGWKDYIYWQTEDRKTLKKINNLIDDINQLQISSAHFQRKVISETDNLWYNILEVIIKG